MNFYNPIFQFNFEKNYNIIPNNPQNVVDSWKHRIKHFGDTYLYENNIKDWKFVIEEMDNHIAGLCVHDKKTIIINLRSLYLINGKQLKNLMLHEIAHALTPNHGHDQQWIDKAIEIGCDGCEKLMCKLEPAGEDKYSISFPTVTISK